MIFPSEAKLWVYEIRTYHFHHHQYHHHWSAISIMFSQPSCFQRWILWNKTRKMLVVTIWNHRTISFCKNFTYSFQDGWGGGYIHLLQFRERSWWFTDRLKQQHFYSICPSAPCVFTTTVLKWKLFMIQKTPEFFALTWIEKNSTPLQNICGFIGRH